jgi:hypothetical protein
MRDLRVYIEPSRSGARSERATFYTRRADGPFYRWLDAEGTGRWRYSRVSLDRLTLSVLSIAPWDAIPVALRHRLGEHYVE